MDARERHAMLSTGRSGEFRNHQVRSFMPPDRRPLELDAHDVWVLRGDDELTLPQE